MSYNYFIYILGRRKKSEYEPDEKVKKGLKQAFMLFNLFNTNSFLIESK